MHLKRIASGKFGSLDTMFGGMMVHIPIMNKLFLIDALKDATIFNIDSRSYYFFSHNLNKKSMKTIKEI